MIDDNVISLDNQRPHRVLAARCLRCAWEWIAVTPLAADPWTLECPTCGEQESRAIEANITAVCAKCGRDIVCGWGEIPRCFCEDEP